jgi:hypothetical protein
MIKSFSSGIKRLFYFKKPGSQQTVLNYYLKIGIRQVLINNKFYDETGYKLYLIIPESVLIIAKLGSRTYFILYVSYFIDK